MKRIYVAVIVSMALLAALGLWTMIDGASAYRQRPRMQDLPARREVESSIASPDRATARMPYQTMEVEASFA